MISIQQMQYIIALSEELNFQRASNRSYVTQPTLSMQLKKAEEILGEKVFDRSKNPLELTAFGKQLVPIIRDTLNEFDRIKVLSEQSKGIFKEHIRMAIIPTIAGYMLPDLYTAWQEKLKHVHLTVQEMKTEEILIAMSSKRIDIGILAGPIHELKLRTVTLYNEEIKAYSPSSKSHLISVQDLEDSRPWLLTSGNCLRTQMMHFCDLKSSQDKEEWDYEGGNIDILKRMVDKHGGYTLIPVNYIDNNSADYKTINSSDGEIPAREVVAIVANRNSKWNNLEQIIREIQFKYNVSVSRTNFKLLSWK